MRMDLVDAVQLGRALSTTQAIVQFHQWSFRQAGQCIGVWIFGSVPNTTVPVWRPVGTGCPVVGHRMKMSPLMSFLGNDKIASSEYGMSPNVGVVAALVQGP